MRLNAINYKVIHFKPKKLSPSTPVVLNNLVLEVVPSYKYLGLDITSKLDSVVQWDRVYPLINKNTHLLKQLKSCVVHEKILVNVYKSLVLSYLRYSSTVLISCPEYVKTEMQAFKNKLLRIIGFSREFAKADYGIVDVSDFIIKSPASSSQKHTR